jgi:cytidylate kinase
MKLIGISGTNGAGKDTIGEFLATKHGWLFVSVTEILREELGRRSQPLERKNLAGLSAEWRRQFGQGILIDKAVEIFQSKKDGYKGLAIASLRNPGEADQVHKLGGRVIWMDADPQERYSRIYSRQRSAEDKKTFDQFLQEEKDEMEHRGDHHTLSLSDVKAKADIFIANGGNRQELIKKLETALNL